jgi:hypothetical protein
VIWWGAVVVNVVTVVELVVVETVVVGRRVVVAGEVVVGVVVAGAESVVLDAGAVVLAVVDTTAMLDPAAGAGGDCGAVVGALPAPVPFCAATRTGAEGECWVPRATNT